VNSGFAYPTLFQGMPKRPLSAYNLYFRSERQALLGEDLIAKEYGVADPTKRKHRKTHGKISFKDMARIISEKWKNIPGEDRLPFERQAGEEKRRYREALDLWKAQQRKVADDDIVRKVSLEKSASEDQHAAASATAAAAAASRDDDSHDEGPNDESESDDEVLGAGGDGETEGGTESDSDGDTNANDSEAKPRGGGKKGKRNKTAGAKRGVAAAGALRPTSPRSETAALLIAMPNTGRAAGRVVPSTASSSFVPASVPSMLPGGVVALANPAGTGAYAPADATERVVRDSALLLGIPQSYGVPGRYLPSMQPLTVGYQHAQMDVASAASAAPETAVSLGAVDGNQFMHERYGYE
jgi:HMG (high mobility group) box